MPHKREKGTRSNLVPFPVVRPSCAQVRPLQRDSLARRDGPAVAHSHGNPICGQNNVRRIRRNLAENAQTVQKGRFRSVAVAAGDSFAAPVPAAHNVRSETGEERVTGRTAGRTDANGKGIHGVHLLRLEREDDENRKGRAENAGQRSEEDNATRGSLHAPCIGTETKKPKALAKRIALGASNRERAAR